MENLTVAEVLDRARERQGLKSDYALCKALNCSTQLVANWRHGRNLPDEKRCQMLADLAGLDPFVLIAQMNAQRSKDSEARSLWEAIAERLQLAAHGMAAVIFSVLIATGFVATDARAASATEVHPPASEGSSVYTSYLPGCTILFAALAWLVSRFDRGFVPCFVPAP